MRVVLASASPRRKQILENAGYDVTVRVSEADETLPEGISPEKAVEPYTKAAQVAHEVGLGLNAGHDLNLLNLKFFKDNVPYLDEVSIGHALISDALYLGLERTIDAYRKCLL